MAKLEKAKAALPSGLRQLGRFSMGQVLRRNAVRMRQSRLLQARWTNHIRSLVPFSAIAQ